MSRPLGTAAELERRRKAAVHAVLVEGLSPSVVARAHGVHRVTVQKWLRQAKVPGGLDAKPVHHAPALSDDQLPRLEALLLQGPRAHGWDNDLWTCDRIAQLIDRHFGVRYHPDHVRKLLHERLNWSHQKPEVRAREQDDEMRKQMEELREQMKELRKQLEENAKKKDDR